MGVPMALATDFNPGSSPILSLLATLNLAAVQFRMTVEEGWLGVTRHAAAALGRAASIGTLEVGKRADLALWDFERLADPVAGIGPSPLHRRVWGGQ
jgi:imidazolonepropionase